MGIYFLLGTYSTYLQFAAIILRNDIWAIPFFLGIRKTACDFYYIYLYKN